MPARPTRGVLCRRGPGAQRRRRRPRRRVSRPTTAATTTTTPRSFTYAVYGDAPYGTTPTDTSETDATPAFIARRQRRPGGLRGAARRRHPLRQAVLHRRPTTSRSPTCGAGFTDPLVYTPGDNEWTDCHKKKRGRRRLQRGHRSDRLRDRRQRQPGRLRQRQPGRQPRPGPLDLLPEPGAHARQRTAARPVAGAGRRPAHPDGRASTSRT